MATRAAHTRTGTHISTIFRSFFCFVFSPTTFLTLNSLTRIITDERASHCERTCFVRTGTRRSISKRHKAQTKQSGWEQSNNKWYRKKTQPLTSVPAHTHTHLVRRVWWPPLNNTNNNLPEHKTLLLHHRNATSNTRFVHLWADIHHSLSWKGSLASC